MPDGIYSASSEYADRLGNWFYETDLPFFCPHRTTGKIKKRKGTKEL